MKKIILDSKYTTNIKGLIIDLYINSNCNFNCEYCATKSLDWDRFKPMTFDKAKYIIDCISQSKYNVILCILGGEPTLNKDLNKIIDYANSKSQIKEIELYTNGSTNLSKIHIDKCRVVISIHPYMYSKFRDKILSNISLLNKDKLLVKIMNENISIQNIINDLNNININYLISYINNEDDSFRTSLNSINQKVINVDNKLITYNEYIKDYFILPKEYFYRCKMDSISILENGDVLKYCEPDNIKLYKENVFNNQNCIRDFKIELQKCTRCNTKGCQELEIEKYICKS